jgi:hypothetical protein
MCSIFTHLVYVNNYLSWLWYTLSMCLPGRLPRIRPGESIVCVWSLYVSRLESCHKTCPLEGERVRLSAIYTYTYAVLTLLYFNWYFRSISEVFLKFEELIYFKRFVLIGVFLGMENFFYISACLLLRVFIFLGRGGCSAKHHVAISSLCTVLCVIMWGCVCVCVRVQGWVRDGRASVMDEKQWRTRPNKNT